MLSDFVQELIKLVWMQVENFTKHFQKQTDLFLKWDLASRLKFKCFKCFYFFIYRHLGLIIFVGMVFNIKYCCDNQYKSIFHGKRII